jgi:hypothetical protein
MISPVQTSPFLRPANDHPVIHIVFPFLDFKSLIFASRTCRHMRGRVQKIPPAKLCRERTLSTSTISKEGSLHPEPHVTQVTIGGGKLNATQMDMVLAKYPNVKGLDLGGCTTDHFIFHSLQGRLWVQLILPQVSEGNFSAYDHYCRNLLHNLNWSRLEVLSVKCGFSVHSGNIAWLLPKLQSSALRRIDVIHYEETLPEFIRGLPDSIESFSAYVRLLPKCEALAERLRNPNVQDLNLTFAWENDVRESPAGTKIIQGVLPRFSSLKSISFGVYNGDFEPFVDELCRALQANSILESISLIYDALPLDRFIQILNALLAKPHLKTIRITCNLGLTGASENKEYVRVCSELSKSASLTLKQLL